VRCWHGYLSETRCRFACGPADITATHCLLLQKMQIGFGFTFLVPAYPGSPGRNPESHEMVVVVVAVVVMVVVIFLVKLKLICRHNLIRSFKVLIAKYLT